MNNQRQQYTRILIIKFVTLLTLGATTPSKRHLHADVPAEDGRHRTEHKGARGECSLYPRVLSHANKKEYHSAENDDEDAADGVLRRQEGVGPVADCFVDLGAHKKGVGVPGVGGVVGTRK